MLKALKNGCLKASIMPAYKLYPAAEIDLENTWQYSVDNWGVDRALQYLDDLDKTFGLLAESPFISREQTEFIPPVHIHPHSHHLIVYLRTKNGIAIVRVLHESMNISAQLEQD